MCAPHRHENPIRTTKTEHPQPARQLTPLHCPSHTHTFSRGLTLTAQRNHHKQLLCRSQREQGTLEQLSLQRHNRPNARLSSDLLAEGANTQPHLSGSAPRPCPLPSCCFCSQATKRLSKSKNLCCRFRTLFIYKGLVHTAPGLPRSEPLTPPPPLVVPTELQSGCQLCFLSSATM